MAFPPPFSPTPVKIDLSSYHAVDDATQEQVRITLLFIVVYTILLCTGICWKGEARGVTPARSISLTAVSHLQCARALLSRNQRASSRERQRVPTTAVLFARGSFTS
eukprot:482488-Rhodomonas_salina.1